jgi:hypothetical protein
MRLGHGRSMRLRAQEAGEQLVGLPRRLRHGVLASLRVEASAATGGVRFRPAPGVG